MHDAIIEGADVPPVTLKEAQELVEQARGPKITIDSITAKIAHHKYIFFGKLTICVMEMQNGFFVVGKAAPASNANYNEAVGMRYAYEDALRQLWPLEGYLLCENLYMKKAAADLMKR